MAHTITDDRVHNEGIFAPEHISTLGRLTPSTDLTSHPGLIGGFAPGRRMRFGEFEVFTDSQGNQFPANPTASADELQNPEALSSGPLSDHGLGLLLLGKKALSSEPTTPAGQRETTIAELSSFLEVAEVNSENTQGLVRSASRC